MKKILFYTESKWAFGTIHYGLCRELYKHGIYATVLDWDISYSKDEFNLLINKFDSFVTTPPFVLKLHYEYGVPLNKIIAVAHGQWDILLAKKNANFDFYPCLKSFVVISNILKAKCEEWKISVTPKIAETGIHFDLFYNKIPEKLNILGYGGAVETFNFWGEKIKRGNLVKETADDLGMELKTHNFYNFNCMPSYYESIDSLIMSSSEEAAGLPIMEAAASGRLILGTPVGYFEEHAPKGAGILLPLNENDFKKELKRNILYYKDNINEFKQKCLEIQQYAKDNYDWSKKISSWVELFS
jgi:glycosyltransferase involved in cell wall biosynthesis